MADEKFTSNLDEKNVGGGSSKDQIELTSGNVLGILNTEQQTFDDNHFAELLDNLEKSECTNSERENSLNNMGKFNKLGIENFNKLLLFCNTNNKYINIDSLIPFHDLPYKELVRSVNFVSFKRLKSLKESYLSSNFADELEKFLDIINCTYDNESFKSLCSAGHIYDLLITNKRHDISVKSTLSWWDKYESQNLPLITTTFQRNLNDTELDSFLGIFSQDEIDEYFLIRLFGDCSNYFDLKVHDFNFKRILDKYHLDYYKFCRYYFINGGHEFHDNNKDQKRNKYDFDMIRKFREYLKTNNIQSFIPDDLEDILKKDEFLTKMEPKNMIKYCEKYELIGEDDVEYPIRKKFVIMFNPVDKKLSCVLGSVKAHHRDLGGFGNIILGGGYFKTTTQDSYVLEGYSEEFGSFSGYENWLSKIISSKIGLRYKCYKGYEGTYIHNSNNYPDKDEEYNFINWYYERMGYGKYRSGGHG